MNLIEKLGIDAAIELCYGHHPGSSVDYKSIKAWKRADEKLEAFETGFSAGFRKLRTGFANMDAARFRHTMRAWPHLLRLFLPR